MKNAIIALAVILIAASCNPRGGYDKDCYGVLMDSLTRLIKVQERLNNLENGQMLAKEYEAKIEALQHKIDSMSHNKRLNKHSAQSKHMLVKKHKRTRIPSVQPKPSTNGGNSIVRHEAKYYYDNESQKYMYYDYEKQAYYSVNPVTGEKRY